MKKILVVMMMALAMSMSVQASDIVWANNTEIYKASGAADLVLDGDTSYFIRLYESVDNVIDFSIVGDAISLGADTYTGIEFFWNSGGADGFCNWVVNGADTSFGVNAGDKIYSVIFDTSLIAGSCAIVDSSLLTVTASGILGVENYDAGGVNGGMQGAGGDWMAIPEPATMLLFAIGGMSTWLLRRRQQA